jgi:hypothetical protein
MSEPCLCGDPYCGRCFPGRQGDEDQEVCVRCRVSLYTTPEDLEPASIDTFPWCSEECRDIDADDELRDQ